MRALAFLISCFCVAVAAQRPTLPTSAPPSTAQRPTSDAVRFENVAASSGLGDFLQVGGGTAEKRYIPEVMSGGVCADDLDRDGWTDIVLVSGGSFESALGKTTPPPHGVYRNTKGRFENVTTKRASATPVGAWDA